MCDESAILTSTAILFKYIEFVGINAEVYIPDRIKDGYGITKNSINYFSLKKVDILIALDCGTNDADSISYAKEKGIEISKKLTLFRQQN